MDEPIWIEKPEALIAHSQQLARHGGPEGTRDESLLGSALAKPRNVFLYGDNVAPARLAASYAYEITRNHPFVDGNKRTALVISLGFLRVNGWTITASMEDRYLTFLGLAEGSVSEVELTAWFTRHATPLNTG